MLKKLDPIPEGQKKEWDDIIEETKEIILSQDNSSYRLILIAARINGRWGELKVDRWAEECNISRTTAWLYKRMSRQGFNEAFMNKYGSLGMSKLTYILERHSSLKSKYAIEWLDWALAHPDTPAEALDAYMMNNLAPPQWLNDAKKNEIKAGIKQKQLREQYSPEVQRVLEEAIERHPHLAERILDYRITPEADVKKVEEALGIKGADDNAAAFHAKKMLDKLKINGRWLAQNENDIKTAIEGLTEYPDLIQGELFRIARIVNTLLKVKKAPIPRLDPARVKRSNIRTGKINKEAPNENK